MEELHVLDEVYYSLKIGDPEWALIELQDYEGDPYDQIRTLIAGGFFEEAKELCCKRMNELDCYE